MLERWSDPANLLSAAALLILPLAVVVPMAITWLAAICATVLAIRSIARRRSPITRSVYAALLTALLLWCALTVLWSIDPALSLARWLRLAVIALGAVVLIDAARSLDAAGVRRVETALIWGTAVGLALIFAEVATGAVITEWVHGPTGRGNNALTHLSRGASVVAIAACLVAFIAERRFGWIGLPIVAVVTAPALLLLNPGAPVLAFAVAVCVFGLARMWPRATGLAFVALVVVGTLAAPVLPGTFLSSARYSSLSERPDMAIAHRLAIWEFTADRVKERPWLGWGLDAARELPGGSDMIQLAGPGGAPRDAMQLPMHPHNAFLQSWLELGLPGALLMGGFVVAVIAAIRRNAYDIRAQAACLATAGAVLITASLSYGVWQSWWQATMWLFGALAIAVTLAPGAARRAAD